MDPAPAVKPPPPPDDCEALSRAKTPSAYGWLPSVASRHSVASVSQFFSLFNSHPLVVLLWNNHIKIKK
jgi:hypothetical protein